MSYLNDLSVIWEEVKSELKKSYPSSTIDFYMPRFTLEPFDGRRVILNTDGFLPHKYVTENLADKIKELFVMMLGFEIDLEINYTGNPEEVHQRILRQIRGESPIAPEEKKENIVIGGTLPPYNFEYTFDNFIVGSSNKFAHAACWAVADRPTMDYNPLFIYGPSGLGKTHLLYAITNEVKKKNPNAKIIYIKGEDFTNQLIESLKQGSMSLFRTKYRSCDVLLIDDIQFIAGKVSTQEEFFHTFNALFEDRKQIILTSDRPPRDIKTLEERLKTRFEWGLIADIQPPDLELRIAIFKKKAEQANLTIPDEVLVFLAENLRSNIRQIEGAIKKFRARSFIEGKEIDMEFAKSCISELLGGAEPTSVTIEKIFSVIYKKYNIKKDDIIGTRRTKEVAAARHIAIYMVRTITEMSLPNIGKVFNRDHSTVMSSIEAAEKKLRLDPMLEIEVKEMIKEVTDQN